MSKVYVGMSGGVDSSVTAALLQQLGHDVIGVYMKNWTQDLPGMKCPWADDLADAKRVAVQLNIPFKVFDFQKEYKQQVVDYMIDEYKAGRTPNPDVMCNQEIKFNLFLKTALAEGADYVATGHYARTRDGRLFAGLDTNKDQSYFLYRVTGEALQKTLLPIGELTKPEVRAKAAELGLATAAKKDSQGICFIGNAGTNRSRIVARVESDNNYYRRLSGFRLRLRDHARRLELVQRHRSLQLATELDEARRARLLGGGPFTLLCSPSHRNPRGRPARAARGRGHRAPRASPRASRSESWFRASAAARCARSRAP